MESRDRGISAMQGSKANAQTLLRLLSVAGAAAALYHSVLLAMAKTTPQLHKK